MRNDRPPGSQRPGYQASNWHLGRFGRVAQVARPSSRRHAYELVSDESLAMLVLVAMGAVSFFGICLCSQLLNVPRRAKPLTRHLADTFPNCVHWAFAEPSGVDVRGILAEPQTILVRTPDPASSARQRPSAGEEHHAPIGN